MQSVIDKHHVLYFFNLQQDLVEAFFEKNPDLKDMEWLLDFPKSGDVHVNGERWIFTRHGKGIRFIAENVSPRKIVDVNSQIRSPELIDIWRLSQYFSSNDESHIKKMLSNMVTDGELEEISGRFYKIK